MIRTRRWKYIRRFLEHGVPSLANCDNSPTKELLLEHGWGRLPMAEEQLYDLVFDPNEAANGGGRPAPRRHPGGVARAVGAVDGGDG